MMTVSNSLPGEWGDLTQWTTAALAAKSAAPFTIFTSATLALWTASGMSVYGGHKLKQAVQPERLQRAAAIIFLAVGIAFFVNIRF